MHPSWHRSLRRCFGENKKHRLRGTAEPYIPLSHATRSASTLLDELAGGAATDSALAERRCDAVESDLPMPTLRWMCVFVTALILVLSASANVDAVTRPIPTVTFTCCGDCNGDGVVTLDELQTCVPPIIPEAPFSPCPACDCNHDGNVGSAGELTQIVTNILNGCPGAPTKAASATTPTPTPTPRCPPECASCSAGDCDGDGEVTIAELVKMIDIALGNADTSICLYGLHNATTADVSLIIQAVNDALNGCP